MPLPRFKQQALDQPQLLLERAWVRGTQKDRRKKKRFARAERFARPHSELPGLREERQFFAAKLLPAMRWLQSPAIPKHRQPIVRCHRRQRKRSPRPCL